jgi:prepilin-type processing-associated H-X9-DG protein
MPANYAHPGREGPPSSRGYTSYFVFTGPSTAVGAGDEPQIQKITDGTSNTIMAVEAKREIPWTKPEDIPFEPNAPLPELGGFTPEGFNALFADGSVRYIKKSIHPTVLKALITRDGGEVISSDSY